MIGGPHVAVGAAIGALCPRVFKKFVSFPRLRPPRTHSQRLRVLWASSCQVFVYIGGTSIVALMSHFVCDHFHHLEYYQMGMWWGGLQATADGILVACFSLYIRDRRYPLLERLCVASGVFWSALPDGILWLHMVPKWKMLWAKEFLAFHWAVHTPTPSYGVVNQFAVEIVSLLIFQQMARRRLG